MTSLPRRRTLAGRRRVHGRHRKVRQPRRPAHYTAVGVLALAGGLGSGVMPGLAGAAAPSFEPPARPAPRPRVQAVRAAPVRASRTRWVTTLVEGQTYHGRATWYGPGFAGHRTASGEIFDPAHDLTTAHRWLPFGTLLRVCRAERCVIVRVNDRGPFGNALLDLSRAAAEQLGLIRAGIAPVTATVVVPRRHQVPA
jgi:rare lipoprotein A